MFSLATPTQPLGTDLIVVCIALNPNVSVRTPLKIFHRREANFFFPRLLCFSFHFFGGDGGAAAGPAQRSNSMLISFTRGLRDL